VKAVAKTIAGVEGVQAKCDQDAETVTLTAVDDAAAQKALDALAAAGFHGTTGNDKLTIKDDSGAKPGKVKKLEVSGVHNCCGGCTNRIKSALKDVSGADSSTIKSKETTFTVEGDFDAAALVNIGKDRKIGLSRNLKGTGLTWRCRHGRFSRLRMALLRTRRCFCASRICDGISCFSVRSTC